MALDFLSLIPTVASLYSAYKGSKPTAAETAQQQQLANEQYYQEQLADPNSPLMKAYQTSNKELLDRQFADSINTMVNQNRRLTAMGRAPLFDPERGDQQILRAQQMGYQQNADQARLNAQQTISGLASGAGSLASGYGGTVANAQKRQTQQNYLPVNLANAGSSILQAVRGNQPTSTLASPRLTPSIPSANTGYNSGGFDMSNWNVG